jgi:hypothetical protein
MQDNKPSTRRIAIATICATMGTAFMGLTALQSEGSWPEWAKWFLGIGISLFIIALIILVPSQWWSWVKFKRKIGDIRRLLYSNYLWIRYRPEYIIEKPTMEESLSHDNRGVPEVQYRLKFGISIKNNARPIRVRLHHAYVNIEQEAEWGKNTLYMGNSYGRPESDIEMKPCDKGHWDLVVHTSLKSNATKDPPDFQKTYQCEIKNLYIILPKSNFRKLHKKFIIRQ